MELAAKLNWTELNSSARVLLDEFWTHVQGGSKSNLLILSEYVNKTEDMRNVNKHEHLERKWSIVWYFDVNYFTSQLFYV